ncbi:hypothetical protein EV682_12016 [Iodobacter fluviatilis]|uniref:Uncharacterized protein n=1 Tax=Iodobacter fluviatilis TaxID=537 RepID=A0A377SRU4_9NEIS|nr:hypothetical protein EV682_12016 [Iodobacter fluviatilis]STR44784.1 Uncharacterised protein [Iodobacter fluviatilis]
MSLHLSSEKPAYSYCSVTPTIESMTINVSLECETS